MPFVVVPSLPLTAGAQGTLKHYLVVFGVVAVLTLAAWFTWARLGVKVASEFLMHQGGVPADAGAWGDTFGAFSAVIGALGLAGVVATLWQQATALREQREDLHRQRFEDTFFQLLGLLRELRHEIRFDDWFASQGKDDGADSLAAAADIYERYVDTRSSSSSEMNAEELGLLYRDGIHKHGEQRLGPYFRVIYTILRRISEEQTISGPEKAKYGNILRSQLGSADLTLIAGNGLTDVSGNFKQYINEFRLLKYLPQGAVRAALVKTEAYPPSTFEARD